MASNITEIGNALNNTNFTFPDINTTDILTTAISQSNQESSGLMGLFVFIVMGASIFIYLYKFRSDFAIFDQFGLSFITLSIWIDIGIYLLIWGIVTSYETFIIIYTIYFILCFFSQLKKDMVGGEI